MAQEPRDLVMRNAPEYPASAAVGFTAVNSRPSRAQAAKLDMVAPPGTQSSLETSPETTALQEDLPTEHGHALGKTERVVDPTPPTDPQSRRTNSPSPYKRPTDFRIIPYTPPAEKKRKRLATDDPNDDSERPSPESHARAASDDHGSTSNLESDDDDDDDSPEAGMRPVEDQDPESAQSRNPSLDRHHQKQSQAQAKVARSTAGDQRESHGQKQSERTDSAYDNAGAISHIIEKPEDQDPEEGHGSALKKETALSSRLSSENPGITEITKAGVQIDPQKKRKRQSDKNRLSDLQTSQKEMRRNQAHLQQLLSRRLYMRGLPYDELAKVRNPQDNPDTIEAELFRKSQDLPQIAADQSVNRIQLTLIPRPIGEQASDNRGPIRTEESQPRLPAISEESQCDFRGQWGSPRDEQPPHRPYSQDRSVGPEYPLIMARAPSDPYRRPSDVEPGQQDQPVSWVSEQQKDQHSQRAGLFRSVLDAQLTPLARGTRYNQEQPLPPPQTIFEIMKKGRPYSRSDPVLVEFRKRCKALLRKYNFALMAGICEDGDMRLLRDVIMPPLDGPGEESFKTGRLAEDARIEGPFTCDYGWNVTLGEKVAIGPNCNFEDGAEIFIGPRTVIGPDVKIYTSDPWKWPFREDGNEVKTISRRIVIEEDVFIGGNSTILSGIRIKKGTIVAAGSVLNRRMFGPDGVIPERSFVTGNPARVLRDVP